MSNVEKDIIIRKSKEFISGPESVLRNPELPWKTFSHSEGILPHYNDEFFEMQIMDKPRPAVARVYLNKSLYDEKIYNVSYRPAGIIMANSEDFISQIKMQVDIINNEDLKLLIEKITDGLVDIAFLSANNERMKLMKSGNFSLDLHKKVGLDIITIVQFAIAVLAEENTKLSKDILSDCKHLELLINGLLLMLELIGQDVKVKQYHKKTEDIEIKVNVI